MSQGYLIFLDIIQRDYVKWPLVAILAFLIVFFTIASLIRGNLALAGWEKKKFVKRNGKKYEVSDSGKFIVRDGDLVVEVSTMPGDGIKVDPDRVRKMDEAKLDYTYDDTNEANASYIIESKPTKKIDDTENTMEEEDASFVSYDEIVPEKKNEFKPIDMPKIFKDKQSDPEQMKILEEQQREFENSLSDEVEEVRREIMAKNAAQQDKDSAVGGLAHSDGPVEEVSAISSKEPIVLPVITRAGKKDDIQEEEKSVAAEESAVTADSGTDVQNKPSPEKEEEKTSQNNAKYATEQSADEQTLLLSARENENHITVADEEKIKQIAQERIVTASQQRASAEAENYKEKMAMEAETEVKIADSEKINVKKDVLKKLVTPNPPVGQFDEAVVFGKYEIYQNSDGSLRYHLFTNKGEAIYGHGGFKDIKTVLSHINSFKLSIQNGKFEIQGDKELGYRFVLTRGEALFRGIIHKSKDRVKQTIEAIKYYGLTEIIRMD